MPDAVDFVPMINANRGELATTMGITVTSADPDELTATMPVAGNRQPYGLLHGGASAVLAETAGSIHAALLAPADHYPVGIELSCSHSKSSRDGTVTAVCRPVVTGRTLATFVITIRDEDDRLCCSARLTCMYRRQEPAASR